MGKVLIADGGEAKFQGWMGRSRNNRDHPSLGWMQRAN